MTDDEIRALTVSPYKLTRNIANAALEARANLRFVIDERDRTFALMLARADTAEADLAAARAELATVKAERDAAVTAARLAHDALWELNPSNYDHDEVCKANDGAIEAILTLAPIIGETHGKVPEWWATRAALQSTPAQKEQGDE